MIEITKKWYVSYQGTKVSAYGCSDGLYVLVGSQYAEFDTEAELIQFMEINGLGYENEED